MTRFRSSDGATFLALGAAAIATAAYVGQSRLGAWLTMASLAICLGLGIAGVFSIGLPLLVAFGHLAFSGRHVRVGPWVAASSFGVAALVLIVGFLVTSLDSIAG